jgi:hypothetical protein
MFLFVLTSAGVSSYSPKALGNPALGCADTLNRVCDNVWVNTVSTDRLQEHNWKPTLNKEYAKLKTKNTSTVCPERFFLKYL